MTLYVIGAVLYILVLLVMWTLLRAAGRGEE